MGIVPSPQTKLSYRCATRVVPQPCLSYLQERQGGTSGACCEKQPANERKEASCEKNETIEQEKQTSLWRGKGKKEARGWGKGTHCCGGKKTKETNRCGGKETEETHRCGGKEKKEAPCCPGEGKKGASRW